MSIENSLQGRVDASYSITRNEEFDIRFGRIINRHGVDRVYRCIIDGFAKTPGLHWNYYLLRRSVISILGHADHSQQLYILCDIIEYTSTVLKLNNVGYLYNVWFEFIYNLMELINTGKSDMNLNYALEVLLTRIMKCGDIIYGILDIDNLVGYEINRVAYILIKMITMAPALDIETTQSCSQFVNTLYSRIHCTQHKELLATVKEYSSVHAIFALCMKFYKQGIKVSTNFSDIIINTQ
jgi:hypothetical protein